jgi:hypothetical protein
MPRYTPNAVFGAGLQAAHIRSLSRDDFHVRNRRADVLGGDVAAFERIDQAAERFEQARRFGLAAIDHHDGLAAAERQACHRILVAHASRQA